MVLVDWVLEFEDKVPSALSVLLCLACAHRPALHGLAVTGCREINCKAAPVRSDRITPGRFWQRGWLAAGTCCNLRWVPNDRSRNQMLAVGAMGAGIEGNFGAFV